MTYLGIARVSKEKCRRIDRRRFPSDKWRRLDPVRPEYPGKVVNVSSYDTNSPRDGRRRRSLDHPHIPSDRCATQDWTGASSHISERRSASADASARCCSGCSPGYAGAQDAARNCPKFAAGDGEIRNRHRDRNRGRKPWPLRIRDEGVANNGIVISPSLIGAWATHETATIKRNCNPIQK